jgi:predicted phosphoribosyltransferase
MNEVWENLRAIAICSADFRRLRRIEGRMVIVTDDSISTGSTLLAALKAREGAQAPRT